MHSIGKYREGNEITFIKSYNDKIPIVAEIFTDEDKFSARRKELETSINRVIVCKKKKDEFFVAMHMFKNNNEYRNRAQKN